MAGRTPPRGWRRWGLGVPSVLIWGSNFSDVTSLRSSGLRLHTLTPSAAPAAMAAPRAVVSGIDGFTEGRNSQHSPPEDTQTSASSRFEEDKRSSCGSRLAHSGMRFHRAPAEGSRVLNICVNCGLFQEMIRF